MATVAVARAADTLTPARLAAFPPIRGPEPVEPVVTETRPGSDLDGLGL